MFTRRERLILSFWLLSWLIVPVAAQVRPGLFSTLVTTDTGLTSLLVGGTAGGTAGTGGIRAGTLSLGGGATVVDGSGVTTAAVFTPRVASLSGTLALQTSAVTRWGVNAAGDLTIGGTTTLYASRGSPGIVSGAGAGPSLVGRDYAFAVTIGAGPVAPLVVQFSQFWTNPPICTAAFSAAGATGTSTTTNQVTVYGAPGAGTVVSVLCHGY